MEPYITPHNAALFPYLCCIMTGISCMSSSIIQKSKLNLYSKSSPCRLIYAQMQHIRVHKKKKKERVWKLHLLYACIAKYNAIVSKQGEPPVSYLDFTILAMFPYAVHHLLE